MHKYIYILILTAGCIFAVSSRKLVTEGNDLFSSGDYAQAVEKYKEALEIEPDSQSAKYNLGIAQMKAQAFDEALDTFNSLIAQTSDKTILANARRNAAALKLQDSFSIDENIDEESIEKKMDSINYSIDQLQRAKEIDPKFAEPANQGIEAAKLRRIQLEQFLEQLKQQQQQKQQESNRMQEKLDQLQKQQSELSEKSAQSQDSQDLQQQQQQLNEQTQELMDQLKQSQADSSNQAQEKIEQAMEKQNQAMDQLSKQDMQSASQAQQQAAEKLKEAKEALSAEQGEKNDKKDGQQDKGESEQNEQDDSQAEDNTNRQQNQTQQNENEPDNEGEPSDSTAQDILDKERQNKKLRKEYLMQQRQTVEKDW